VIDEMAAEYAAGMTFAEVAARHGVSSGIARARLLKAGVRPRAPGYRTPTDRSKDAAAYEAYQSGRTLQAVADALGMSRQRVERRIARYESEHGLLKRRHARGSAAAPRELRQCLECGHDFTVGPSSRQRCCSQRCSGARQTRAAASAWPIVAMRRDYESGMGYIRIGKKYGMCWSTARHWLQWAGVPARPPGTRRAAVKGTPGKTGEVR
jgi:transposase-like protein